MRARSSVRRSAVARLVAQDSTPSAESAAGGSSSGRTADSDSANLGSNPSPPANSRIARYARNSLRTFERSAVPVRAMGCSLVSACKECEQCGIGIRRASHRIIGQQELSERFAEGRCLRLYRELAEPHRRRIRVRIERSVVCSAATRPESGAAHLVRIGLAHHDACHAGGLSCHRGGPSSREPRHCEIEASPEEMYRAGFSDEAGPKLLVHAVDLYQDVPEALSELGIVGGMGPIAAERDGIGDLARKLVDRDLDAELDQRC